MSSAGGWRRGDKIVARQQICSKSRSSGRVVPLRDSSPFMFIAVVALFVMVEEKILVGRV